MKNWILTCAVAAAIAPSTAFADGSETTKSLQEYAVFSQDEVFVDDVQTEVESTSYYIAAFGTMSPNPTSELIKIEGYSMPSNDVDLDNAWGAGLALGMKKGMLRAEVEMSSQLFGYDEKGVVDSHNYEFNADSGNLNIFANCFVDIPINEKTTFYVGGGAGLTAYYVDADLTIDSQKESDDSSDYVLGYHFDAGISYKLISQCEIYGGYRYMSSLDPEFDGWEFEAPKMHTAMIGIRYTY